MRLASLSLLILVVFSASQSAWAENQYQNQNELIKRVTVINKLGTKIPLDLPFLDESGNRVVLSQFFKDKPVILMPVYYECPMLCGLLMKGFVQAAKILTFTPGQQFEIVTFSFNPKDTPALAAKKKKEALAIYGRPQAAQGWHFLAPADSASIDKITDAIGFRYQYDQGSQQFAHAAMILVLTPDGHIARYFPGVEFSPKDLRFSLIDASGGKIGTFFDQLVLLCYHYDPTAGKYGLLINRVMQLMGIVTVGALGLFIGSSLMQEKRTKAGI